MTPPPGEITMVNLTGGIIRARSFYNPIAGAFQYRVMLPDGSPSLIVTSVSQGELREHIRTGKPVPFRPIT